MTAETTKFPTMGNPALNLQLRRTSIRPRRGRAGLAVAAAMLLGGLCATAAVFVTRSRQKRALDARLDERIAQSFPASDPVAQP